MAKIVGKHIKHSANTEIVSKIERETTFLVKSSTPFISALKRIIKILDKFDKASKSNRRFKSGAYNNVKYVKIKGMGRAIEKTLSLGLKFQNELMYKTDVLTGSVEVVDEFKVGGAEIEENKERKDEEEDELDDEDKESVFKKRMASFVEIRVWIKRD
ncbi:ribonucleases P/MRP protein subunit Pop7p [[Candida] railenensis]|uniref:Ribonucleases P/MRP protein subunit Pop7p n=1 Tax=[Candida] railenensis TaxID=45579 RepID=A0A9P0QUU0_9ASCO|nr:ribonucleases P/MRP protein subunit Pop7p [[Candida] railenensis]